MFNKFKSLLIDDTFFYSAVIVLVAIGSFGLGRWSVMHNTVQNPIVVKNEALEASVISTQKGPASTVAVSSSSTEVTKETALYVGSKKGTKYHLLTCPGAKQISEANKRFFSSKEDAQKQGYLPASNCKGI